MLRPNPRLVYQQGDHLCTLYSTREEQLAAAIEYLREGFARGERGLYVCGEHTPDELRHALERTGVNVAAAERRGALILVTKREAHLKGGTFGADKMVCLLQDAVDDALRSGFKGLCAAGDMDWVLDHAPGSDELLEYEARLNEFYRTHQALGLCQYHRHRLPGPVLEACLATHPRIRVEGPILLENPFYELPAEAMKQPVRDGRSMRDRLEVIDGQAGAC